MKNFYKKGSAMPLLRFIFPKKNYPFLLLNPLATKGSEDTSLSNPNKDSYANYLASLIYEYQMKLKYDREESDTINTYKKSGSRVNRSCKLISQFISIYIYKPSTYSLNSLVILLYFLFLNFFINTVYGQFYSPTSKSIYIGDKVPEELFSYVHKAVDMNTKVQSSVQLSEYRNKLIILDFWASWCGPCKYSLSKLDSIVSKMGDERFIVVPVTYQIPKEIDRTLDQFSLQFTSIISDTILSQYFPHSTIPYMVWIKDEKVIAFPKSDYATADIIDKVINNKPFQVFNLEKARIVDPAKPLFTNSNGNSIKKYMDGNVQIIGYVPSYTNQNLTKHSDGKKNIMYAVNLPLPSLLHNLYSDQIFPLFRYGDKDAIQWKVSDTKSNLYINRIPSIVGNQMQDSLYKEWLINYTFGFSVEYDNGITEKEAKELVKKSLNEFLKKEYGVKVSLSTSKPQRYAVLRPIVDTEKVQLAFSMPSDLNKGIYRDSDKISYVGYSFKNQFITNLSIILSKVNELKLTKTEILDQTGLIDQFVGNFYFDSLLFKRTSILQINEFLKRYELELIIQDKTETNVTVSDIH